MQPTMTNSFHYTFTTKGEALYAFLRDWLTRDVSGNAFDNWFPGIEYYSDNWNEYIEQSVSIWLTGRIVAAARSFAAEIDEYSDQLSEYLNEFLNIPKEQRQRLVRLASAAAEASDREMSKGLKSQMRDWAIDQHPHCYMCSVQLDFTNSDPDTSFTRDHVWPSSYGGDSVLENLLPACGKCNSERKAHFATWAGTGIQSTLLRRNPSTDAWTTLNGTPTFALQSFAAQKLAISEQISLKEAYLRVGPWRMPPEIADTTEVIHFFNLRHVRNN